MSNAAAAFPSFNDLGTIVEVNAVRSPQQAAVKEADGRVRTYRDLDGRSTRLAIGLRQLGLAPGDRIAGWMDDVIEYVELYVAAAKAGLVMVPINNRLTASEADFQLEHTGARALVYTPEIEPRVDALTTSSDLILIAAGTGPSRGRSFDALIETSPARTLPRARADAPWMICFTSGTTGRPKGATLTNKSVMTQAHTQMAALRIPLYGVNIQAVSMSFPATVATHLVSHMLAGGTQVLAAAKWDSERLLDLIEREGGTHIYVPGPALAKFTAATAANPRRWRTLRSVLHAGSRADPSALAALADVIGSAYLEAWGMTEISGGLNAATAPGDVLDPDDRFFSTVGRPVPGTIVKVVDDERQPVDVDDVGELVIRSAGLFAGYWNDEEATAAVVEDGWYYSGDMGSIDEFGRISISDRRSNLIVSGGMNVYPAEVELAVERCPGVLECAVVGVPHPRWGQTPVAVVVPAADSELTETEVIDSTQDLLAGYKKPTRVLFVSDLPRTTGGKIARGVLRERLDQMRDVSQA